MRMTIQRPGESDVIMKIEGKLSGLQVPELRRAWMELAPSLAEKHLLVDLRDVTFVDSTGRSLLADIYAGSSAQFLADTPLTKYFAEQAQQNVSSDSNSRH